MNSGGTENANKQALLATLCVSGIALFVVCVNVFVGGGSASVEYDKENLTVLLGGTFAFFAVSLWIIFKVYTSILRFFVEAGNIASETARHPGKISQVEPSSTETSDQTRDSTTGTLRLIVLSPRFKIPVLTTFVVSALALILSLILWMFSGSESPPIINLIFTLSSATWKIGFTAGFGMIFGASLVAFDTAEFARSVDFVPTANRSQSTDSESPGTPCDANAKTITHQQLDQTYAINPRRKELFAKLNDELDAWRVEHPKMDVYLFGSFLTDRKEPGDIDVLMTAPVTGPPKKLPRVHEGDVQVLYQISMPPLTKEQLITKFNEHDNNKAKGIKVSTEDAIQLVDS